MFKILAIAALVSALCASSANAAQPGHHVHARSVAERREASTNGERFARGLPPLKPRTPSRSWTAAKRQQSPNLANVLLSFDDAVFSGSDGPVPNPYSGISFGCSYSGCGYAAAASYPSWTAASSPNSFYFRSNGLPTLTPYSPVLSFRLKSLYCAQAQGVAQVLTLTGTLNGAYQFTEDLDCTYNTAGVQGAPPTLNTFTNLPLVDSIVVTTNGRGPGGGWTFDDMAFTQVIA